VKCDNVILILILFLATILQSWEGQEIKLKKEHVYYYQIMGQLHDTKRKKNAFFRYTLPNGSV